MEMSVEYKGNDCAIIYLRGEVDVTDKQKLEETLSQIMVKGVFRVALNMLSVRYFNSAFITVIMNKSRQLKMNGGQLVLSRPSHLAKRLLENLSIHRVIPTLASDDLALAVLRGGAAALEPAPASTQEPARRELLFSPTDLDRVRLLLSQSKLHRPGTESEGFSGIGDVLALDAAGCAFDWGGGQTGMSSFAMSQLLALGTRWNCRFRLPSLSKDHYHAEGQVISIEEHSFGIRAKLSWIKLDAATRDAINQAIKDEEGLEQERKKHS